MGPGNPHRPSKRLGQNFLLNQNIASDIVSSIHLSQSDTVLEPGPGHGALTRLLQKEAGKVVAVEKDPVLVRELTKTFRDYSNVVIVQGDILTRPLPEFNKIVSTPPYYLSSKLALFISKTKFDMAGVVFQKEFGERLLAEPGTREYGRLTVAVRRRLKIEKIREISRTSFRPRPKVDSILLRLTPLQNLRQLNEQSFEEVVRGVFTQRRRLTRSALAHFLTKRLGRESARKMMREIAVPDARVFQLSIAQLEELSEQLAPRLGGKTASEIQGEN